MKKKIKTMVSILLVMVICTTYMPAINVYAITKEDVTTALDKLVHQYEEKRTWPASYGAECYSFAHFVFNRIFGRNAPVGSYNSGHEYKFDTLSSDISTIGILTPGYTGSDLRTLLNKAAPGDYLQVKRRSSGGPHSMIVYAVNSDNQTITIFDANTDYRNTVKKYVQTYSTFYQKNQGVSLYRYKDYIPEKIIISTEIQLSSNNLPVVIGTSRRLKASVLPENATNKKVTWSSSNSNIAAVDANGNVTGMTVGQCTITAKAEDGGCEAACLVRVKPAAVSVTGVELSSKNFPVLKGKSRRLTATAYPTNATNKKVTWKSSNENIARVDANGTVTGVQVGSCNVTVQTADGGFTASCLVRVKPDTDSVTGIQLNSSNFPVKLGTPRRLKATVLPENAANRNVIWKSSDTSVATVDSRGTVTGISVGSCTVTATTEDGGYTAKCLVRIKP